MSEISYNRCDLSFSDASARFGFSITKLAKFLNFELTTENCDKVRVTSYAESSQGLLLNFHYAKNQHESPVGHIRGQVVLFPGTSSDPVEVVPGIRAPRIVEDGQSEIFGIPIATRHGNVRIRIFKALGKVWFSSHRSLDCTKDRCVEFKETFGQSMSRLDLSFHTDAVFRSEGNLVVSFVLPSNSSTRIDDGLFVWSRLDSGSPWNMIGDCKMWNVQEVLANFNRVGPVTSITFYNPATRDSCVILSPKRKYECEARGKSGSLFESLEAGLRADGSISADCLLLLSEKSIDAYQQCRAATLTHLRTGFNTRYVKGAYFRTKANLHAILCSMQESTTDFTKSLTLEEATSLVEEVVGSAEFAATVATHPRFAELLA